MKRSCMGFLRHAVTVIIEDIFTKSLRLIHSCETGTANACGWRSNAITEPANDFQLQCGLRNSENVTLLYFFSKLLNEERYTGNSSHA
jgi:hypothetical protein